MVGASGRLAIARLAAPLFVAAVLVAVAGCSNVGDSNTNLIRAESGGTVTGSQGQLRFEAYSFGGDDVQVSLRTVDLASLEATPDGPPIGALDITFVAVSGSTTVVIPGTAEFRLSEQQTGGARLNVYYRRSGGYTRVGEAVVYANGRGAIFESGINRDGLYVVGPPAA